MADARGERNKVICLGNIVSPLSVDDDTPHQYDLTHYLYSISQQPTPIVNLPVLDGPLLASGRVVRHEEGHDVLRAVRRGRALLVARYVHHASARACGNISGLLVV